MRVAGEIYKGIEFVRISALPDDQKQLIWTSLKRDKIIKILKNDCLLNDCVQTRHYNEWYTEHYFVNQLEANEAAATKPAPKEPELELAFK